MSTESEKQAKAEKRQQVKALKDQLKALAPPVERAKRRGDVDGLKEVLAERPLVTRAPVEDVQTFNFISKRLDLKFGTTINLAVYVLNRFTEGAFDGTAMWDNPAVRWLWLKPQAPKRKLVESGDSTPEKRKYDYDKGEETGYMQMNFRLPKQEYDKVVSVVKHLQAKAEAERLRARTDAGRHKAKEHDVNMSEFLLTALHWCTHSLFPGGGNPPPTPAPYSPVAFVDSAKLIELPALRISEANARKILAAFGVTESVPRGEISKRLLEAVTNSDSKIPA